jgi:hypothetical protein
MTAPPSTAPAASITSIADGLYTLLRQAPLDEKDSTPSPLQIARFNRLVGEANSVLPSNRVGMLKVFPHSCSWGALEYQILRVRRVMNGRTPDHEQITLPTLITPGRFFEKTVKAPSPVPLAVDERGNNLRRVDVNLVWFHMECRGEETDIWALNEAVLYLEDAIDAYVEGKGRLFVRDNPNSPRQIAVLMLRVELRALKAALRLAKALHPYRKYSDGGINIAFQESFVDLLMLRADATGYIGAALRGRPRDVVDARIQGISFAERAIANMGKGLDAVSTASDLSDVGAVVLNVASPTTRALAWLFS